MTHPEQRAPLLRLIGLASRRMIDELQDRLVSAGFDDHRIAHNNAMAHVPEDGIRLTELADKAGMTKQAMSELVADLERLGYLQRSPDPDDGRAKRIGFTDRGRRAVEVVLSSFGEMEADLADRIGPAGMRSLRRSLLAMLDEPVTDAAYSDASSATASASAVRVRKRS